MAEHHADQDHQPIERPELSLPDVEILVIREPVGLERMQIIPLVKAVPDAVDVDQLVVQQRRERSDVVCAGGFDTTPFQRSYSFESRQF